ncbi:hypothetical protein [Leuconostoc falkenbergense]|uniref:hypothetical protein n=1 Tax=Leuconostoc falkenbergense TaxID=2766470 RepID=UPI001F54B70B|nr:hypothetical protein [Leuconostoc falkenbergense]MDV3545333.1 hypothetical protein [Leuconostoc falkenbergense]
MAINIEQVKRRRTTAQPRRPNFHRLKRHHPILKTLLLAMIGILIVTGAVIYVTIRSGKQRRKFKKLVIRLLRKQRNNLLSKQVRSNKWRHRKVSNLITQGLAAYLAKKIC